MRELWKIIEKNPEVDFLKNLKNPMEIKKRISYLILTTDVAQHFKNLENLKALK